MSEAPAPLDRRSLLKTGLAAGVAAVATTGTVAADREQSKESQGGELKGRIKQSMVNWCYAPHFDSVEAMCAAAAGLGIQSIELIDPKHWPTLKKHGLTCAIAGSHGFRTGLNNPKHWDECLDKLRERIGQCQEAGVQRVITFTGMADGISREEGADNCVKALKEIVGLAEKNDVTLCLEMLNTRDDSHPMKGHPGYQGDDVEYCVDILERVGSEYCKLLFDIYHVQIMHGDVIRRIHQHKDYLGHIHTAGNPGRGELDETQELYYPPIMRALLDVGYEGYVGQEFIPTTDVMAGLSQAVQLCDV